MRGVPEHPAIDPVTAEALFEGAPVASRKPSFSEQSAFF
jgi:hypothetical protein